jgi:hypothetical protein
MLFVIIIYVIVIFDKNTRIAIGEIIGDSAFLLLRSLRIDIL